VVLGKKILQVRVAIIGGSAEIVAEFGVRMVTKTGK